MLDIDSSYLYTIPFLLPFLVTHFDFLFHYFLKIILYYISVFTDYKLYYIDNLDMVSNLRNKLKKSEIYNHEQKPSGISFNIPIVNDFFFCFFRIGKDTLYGELVKYDLQHDFFILNIYEQKPNRICVTVFSNRKTFDKLSDPDISESDSQKKIRRKVITYILGSDSFWSQCRFVKDIIDITDFEETAEQKRICDILIDYYNENNFISSILAGPPGSGKSCILEAFSSRCMKQNKNVSIMKPDFTSPGINLQSVLSAIEDSDHHIIIFIDEIDILFQSVLNGIPQHKNIPICVKNKGELNSLLDCILKKKNISIIGTTNLTFHSLIQLEPSFVRRFLFKFDMHCDPTIHDDILHIPVKQLPYQTVDYDEIRKKYGLQ